MARPPEIAFFDPRDPDDYLCNPPRQDFLRILRKLDEDTGVLSELREYLPIYERIHRDFRYNFTSVKGILRAFNEGVEGQYSNQDIYLDLNEKLEGWLRKFHIEAPWMLGAALFTLRFWAIEDKARERLIPFFPEPPLTKRYVRWPLFRELLDYISQELVVPDEPSEPLGYSNYAFQNPFDESPLLMFLKTACEEYKEAVEEALVGLEEFPSPSSYFDHVPLIFEKSQRGWLTMLIRNESLIEGAAKHNLIEAVCWLTTIFDAYERGAKLVPGKDVPYEWPPPHLWHGFDALKDAAEDIGFFEYMRWMNEKTYREKTLESFADSELLTLLATAFSYITWEHDDFTAIREHLLSIFKWYLQEYMQRKLGSWNAQFKRAHRSESIYLIWLAHWNVRQTPWTEILANLNRITEKKVGGLNQSTISEHMETAASILGLKKRKG